MGSDPFGNSYEEEPEIELPGPRPSTGGFSVTGAIAAITTLRRQNVSDADIWDQLRAIGYSQNMLNDAFARLGAAETKPPPGGGPAVPRSGYTPTDVENYIKGQLRAGVTWEAIIAELRAKGIPEEVIDRGIIGFTEETTRPRAAASGGSSSGGGSAGPAGPTIVDLKLLEVSIGKYLLDYWEKQGLALGLERDDIYKQWKMAFEAQKQETEVWFGQHKLMLEQAAIRQREEEEKGRRAQTLSRDILPRIVTGGNVMNLPILGQVPLTPIDINAIFGGSYTPTPAPLAPVPMPAAVAPAIPPAPNLAPLVLPPMPQPAFPFPGEVAPVGVAATEAPPALTTLLPRPLRGRGRIV